MLDFSAMDQAHTVDPQIRALQSSPVTSLKVKAIQHTPSGESILCDTSTGSNRPLVPVSQKISGYSSTKLVLYV